MRILIVEDEKVLSNTIKQSLKDEYEIDQAFDGEEAELYAKQDGSACHYVFNAGERDLSVHRKHRIYAL